MRPPATVGSPAVVGTRPPRASAWLRRVAAPAEALLDRIYGARWNPLYQSGNLAFLCLVATTITGIYLFLFYRIATPYDSVTRIDEVIWGGHLIRSIHRYSADVALVAAGLHLLRKLIQGHTWGPRALAWVSGVLLLAATLVCGWTGLVMAWDVQGQMIAVEGARLIDLLPVLSEPIGRMFSGAAPVSGSFFFMNLFLHVALPLGLIGLLWVHLSHLARPSLVPPRPMIWYFLGVLILFSALFPVVLPPRADLLRVPDEVPLDLFYSFWLPAARELPPWGHLLGWVVAFGALIAVPRVWRPSPAVILPSRVDEERCSGCTQCYNDCPYDAISMVPRGTPSSLSELVARVDPKRCVGCAICTASCAPMGVGPGGRTGRDQLAVLHGRLEERPPAGEIVLFGCDYGLGSRWAAAMDGVVPYAIGCSGALHTSIIEVALRQGYAGAFVLTCPTRDCVFREGPKWLGERVYHDREAELRDRVDKRRVRIGSFSTTAAAAARAVVADFVAEMRTLGEPDAERGVKLELECEAPKEMPG